MRVLHVSEAPAVRGGREVYINDFMRFSSRSGLENSFETTEQVQGSFEGRGSSSYPSADVVILHSRRAWILAPRLSDTVPCVGWAHDYSVFSPGGMAWFPRSGRPCPHRASAICLFKSYAERCVDRRPDRLLGAIKETRRCIDAVTSLRGIVVASEYVRRRLCEAQFPPHRITTIPYFVDPLFLQGSDVSPQVERGMPRVLFVGRLHETKGVDLLLSALQLMQVECELEIVGEGLPRYEHELRDKARQVGGTKIHFTGAIADRRALAAKYASSDVVVVPSAWQEPFGIVGIEAMAMSRPVIAFRVGGIPEWLPDGEAGFLIEPGDTAALAERLDTLLESPRSMASLGEAGRNHVHRNFRAEGHIRRMESVLREVLRVA